MAYKVYFDRLRTLGHAAISGSYVAVPYSDSTGSAVAINPRIICLTNDTDAGMFFSTDGVTDMLYLPKSTFKLFDLTTNHVAKTDDGFVISVGTIIYVKEASSVTTGSVYVEYVYG